ncbi:MAG: hypothetical protein EOP83_10490 [Verrucomicrobiaceae bacterium]|nr:MAG: hypothetical protein EOP83_10490 [Verrucomicrobiaceae bacterium]
MVRLARGTERRKELTAITPPHRNSVQAFPAALLHLSIALVERIPVHLDELGDALYAGGGFAQHRWYLDLRNGQLIPVSEYADLPEEYNEIGQLPEVFLYINPRSSNEGFRMMENYVASLPDGEAGRALARALRLPKPFRSFKDTLFDFPEERDAWFSFQAQHQREAAIEFLEKNQVPWVEGSRTKDP